MTLLLLLGSLTLGAAAEKSTEAGRTLARELCKDRRGGCNVVWTGDPKVPVLHADKCPREHRRIVTNLPYKGDAVCVKTTNTDGEAAGIFDPTGDPWIPYEGASSQECLLRLRCSPDNAGKAANTLGDGLIPGNKPGPGDFQCGLSEASDARCRVGIMNMEYQAIKKDLTRESQANRKVLAEQYKAAQEALLRKKGDKALFLALSRAYRADIAKEKARLWAKLDELSGGEFKESSVAQTEALDREFSDKQAVLAQQYNDKRAALRQEHKDKQAALRAGAGWKALSPKNKEAALIALYREYSWQNGPRMSRLNVEFSAAREKLEADFAAAKSRLKVAQSNLQ